MDLFEDKVGIVTGGAQGIGLGIARHLLKRGMAVVIADIDETAGGECIEEIASFGDVRFIHTDVTDEDSVSQLILQTINFHGRLDSLVNNAGIADPENGPIEGLTLSAWNRVIATNLTGYFLTVKHGAPYLRDAKGAVVNIASSRALQSEPHTEAYSASKGGIVALPHAMAVSFSHQIRVNCISPGWIEVRDWQKREDREAPAHSEADQKQHPAGRVGLPEDVAHMAGYLISERAAFITGQNFIIDGGMTRKMIYAQ